MDEVELMTLEDYRILGGKFMAIMNDYEVRRIGQGQLVQELKFLTREYKNRLNPDELVQRPRWTPDSSGKQ